jgi:hypothetical protein
MPTTIPDYQPPIGDAIPNDPPAPNPPQSPSGSVTNEAPEFNFTYTITSTQQELTNVLMVDSGPEGTAALPGTLAAAVVIQGCLSVQQNSWDTGVVGSVGSKFS